MKIEKTKRTSDDEERHTKTRKLLGGGMDSDENDKVESSQDD